MKFSVMACQKSILRMCDTIQRTTVIDYIGSCIYFRSRSSDGMIVFKAWMIDHLSPEVTLEK